MRIKIYLLLFILFTTLWGVPCLGAGPNVLVLYNFHPLQINSMEFMHTTTQGIKTELPDAIIYSEFLDYGRFPQKKNADNFYNYLLNKYKNEKLDLILAYLHTGSIAFRLRNEIAPGIRVVYDFAQSEDDSNYNPDLDILFPTPLTFSVEENLALYKNWFPDLRNLFVISDEHPISILLLQKIREAVSHQTSPYNLVVWSKETPESIVKKTKKLRPELSLVIFASFESRLAGGYTRAQQEKMVQESHIPILFLEESELFEKTLGGHYFSYKKLGFFIGHNVAHLIKGDIKEFPEVKPNELNVFKVNYKAFSNFNLNTSDIPVEALVLNPPRKVLENDWQLYFFVLLGVAFVFIFFLGYIVYRFKHLFLNKIASYSLRQNPDLIFDLNQDGYVLDINSSVLDLLKKKKEDLVGVLITDLSWLSSSSYDFSKIREEALSRGESSFLLKIEKKDSGFFYYSFSLKQVFVRERSEGFLLVGKDVTPWIKNEEKVKEERDLFYFLFNKSPFPCWVIRDGLFVDCNEKCAEVLGYGSASDILNLHPGALSPDTQIDGQSSFEKANEMMGICIKNGNHHFSWLHKKKNGEIIPVDVSLVSIQSHSASPMIYCIWQDRSFSSKEREEEKTQFEQLMKLHQKRDSLFQAQTTFFKVIGHKIRNPLNVMMGASEILSESDLKMEHEQLVRMISGAAKNLLEFFNSALDFSFVDELPKEVQLKPFSLKKELDALYRHFASRSFNKGLLFEVLFDEHCPDRVQGDARRLRQVLFLLVDNAIKFTESGSVTLRVGRLTSDPRLIQFAIIDTGNGFTDEELDYYFKEQSSRKDFFNSDLEKKGIGIFLSRDLVHSMGGKIGALSSSTTGTTLYFSLPMEDVASVPDSFVASVPDSAKIEGPIEALVADSGDENREVFLLYLRKKSSRIEFAGNGLVALEKFKSNSFNLVLLDLQISKMDTLVLLKEIRRVEKERGYRKVLIIVFSLVRDELTHQAVIDAGADLVLMKPVSNALLQKKIAAFSI